MNKYDLEHKLLKGSVLYLGDIPTYKVTLGEMADNGFATMQWVVSILTMDDTKASELFSTDIENPSAFLFIYYSILQEYQRIKDGLVEENETNNLLCFTIPKFLSLFFKKPVQFNDKYGFIIGENQDDIHVLNDRNYDKFRTILKERNCLVDLDGIDEEENPANEMARKLLEKQKMLREKVRKAKQAQNGDDGLTMADLISIFAEAEHMPLQDVYEKYDVYQFNNQFNRLKIMDDFHVNIQALLAGAKSEDVKLQHWLSKIKKQDD